MSKVFPFLQGHLSATFPAIKFYASKHFKPAATAMFHGIMRMMDCIDETTKAAYSVRKIAILFNIVVEVSTANMRPVRYLSSETHIKQ